MYFLQTLTNSAKECQQKHWPGATQDAYSFLLQADNKIPGEVTLRLMAFDFDTDPIHPKHILKSRPGRQKTKQVKANSKFNITLDFTFQKISRQIRQTL